VAGFLFSGSSFATWSGFAGIIYAHCANIGDKHERRGSEAKIEFREGILETVSEVNMILVSWDWPGEEREDFGGNDADETNDRENFANALPLEGEPKANQEEDNCDNADGIPEVGKAADFADSPDAAILAGDHRDKAD